MDSGDGALEWRRRGADDQRTFKYDVSGPRVCVIFATSFNSSVLTVLAERIFVLLAPTRGNINAHFVDVVALVTRLIAARLQGLAVQVQILGVDPLAFRGLDSPGRTHLQNRMASDPGGLNRVLTAAGPRRVVGPDHRFELVHRNARGRDGHLGRIHVERGPNRDWFWAVCW